MSNDKIQRLKVYMEACQLAVKTAQNPEKKAFFEREVKRTASSIERLTK